MVMQYASMRGTLDGMDTTAITDIAEYFKKELGYDIPPMTPFVGSAFNLTRAGVHADGMMKDAEIYNIFDTEKVLGVPASVSISKTSGTAGIAYWINQHYKLPASECVTKRDEIVVKMKEHIDALYAEGRVTLMTDAELEEMYVSFAKQNPETR
jgi:isopropylmalate/homocitrate/citramalate synthase